MGDPVWGMVPIAQSGSNSPRHRQSVTRLPESVQARAIMQHLKSIHALGLAMLFLAGCLADDIDDPPPDTLPGDGGDAEIPFDEASGFAQKGPFRSGGTATLTALDDDGDTTDDSVSTTIGEWGEYEFDEIEFSGPALIEVEGEYFDEASGNYSPDSIKLSTVVEIPEEDEEEEFLGNVNLISHLMGQELRERMEGEDNGDLDEHISEITDELRRELEFRGDPRRLNLFEHEQDPLLEHESGIMTRYSIAATHVEDIDGLLEDFETAWDNGGLSDDFLDRWSDLGESIEELALEGDLAEGYERLAANYPGAEGAEPSNAGGSHAIVGGCQPTSTTEPVPRLCLNQQQTELLGDRDTAMFWFRAPEDGAYRFVHGGDDTFRVTRIWGAIDDDGEPISSNPLEKRGEDFNRNVSTHILDQGEKVYVEIEGRSEDTGGTRLEHTIEPRRQNEGSADDPAWIFPRHAPNPYDINEYHEHFVGSQDRQLEGERANSQSFYRFISMNERSTLRYYENGCGAPNLNGYTEVELYRSNTIAGAFDGDPDDFGRPKDEEDCYVDLDVSSGALYFLRVTVHGDVSINGPLYARPDATGSSTIAPGRNIHFRETADNED